jgi:hypothetical protein
MNGASRAPDLTAAYDWLDQQAGWSSDTSRRKVAGRVARLDLWALQDQWRRRAKVGRRQVADALVDYYGSLAAKVDTTTDHSRRSYCPRKSVWGTQPRQGDVDESADRGLGGQAAGRVEGVQAVAGEFGRRDVVAEVAGLGAFGQ